MAAPAHQQMLCQGNFELWKDIINQRLESYGLGVWDFYHAKEYAFAAVISNDLSGVDSAVRIMLFNIAPSIHCTVPERLKSHPYALWKHLQQYSKPFRFLDLPAELRENIILQSFPQGVVTPGDTLPPILRASRQLRAESRQIYYQNHHFYLDFEAEAETCSRVNENCDTRVQFLKYWAKKWITNEVGIAAQHLRHVTLYIEESGFEVSLHFSPKEDRLCVELEQVKETVLYEADEEALAGLGEYVDMIEQRRKEGLSTKGESIVDALFHTPQTWGYGVIKMEEVDEEESEEEEEEEEDDND
ncbi:uncharacterized protein MYCFIDRAFT_199286 [Pseudocercospora fijiensis CIRAD86]|uniref:F-box domain-containing protein n=1 Tax=Pseudocercospora fijiensis (strain CIRAD86) TaxID=383855 RepID=M2ZKE1_PSEFD|nr:uncharacterized protein MYCFIDRAFT_199286 [Pseudocercospora fijiensis CIRAD86]EME79559.1 hypothetical protein MYCFIDRAFT_199286 [Pseudocercospora fijiensis CIRAD86]